MMGKGLVQNSRWARNRSPR